jgi:DNA-binding NarL/FixJ family response regulator
VEERRITVLLCDDHKGFRTLLRYTVEEDPRLEVVGEACDGRSGIRAVAELRPDVLLLDISMPSLDGLEAIAEIRELAPRTRIVALSGFEAERMAEPALAAGADAYVEKGGEPAALRSAIRAAAAGR